MTIKAVHEPRAHMGEPDIARPVFFCDYCGREIRHAGEGGYLFYIPDDGSYFEGAAVELHTVHKGACIAAMLAAAPSGAMAMDEEIAHLPGYLENNLRRDFPA